MTFAVRDLMLDILPATDANGEELYLCELATQGPPGQPQPKPAPQPGPKPDRAIQTGTDGPSQFDDHAELASLAFLREQLHQALHP